MFPHHFTSQLLSYASIYFVQGLLLGCIGPSLRELALQSGSNVAAFGPMFSAQGLGALFSAVFTDKLISSVQDTYIVLIPCAFGFALSLLAIPYVAVYGNVAFSLLFFFKGIVVALSNVCINRCCACIYTHDPRQSTKLQHILYGSFGIGTAFGPLLVLAILESDIDIHWVYHALAISQGLAMLAVAATDVPSVVLVREGANESVSLLSSSKSTTEVLNYPPALPSPISGGIFLHIKTTSFKSSQHSETEKLDEDDNEMDVYDPTASFIVLLATFMATCTCGIQFSLAAFLFEYVRSRVKDSDNDTDLFVPWIHRRSFWISSVSMSVFWLSLWSGYFVIRSASKLARRPGLTLVVQAMACAVSSCLVLYRPDDMVRSALGLIMYGLMLSACFTNCLEVLHRSLRRALQHRMSSMIIFGAGCGEIFLPMLSGFFMGGYSGAMFGTIAVLSITCILSIAMFGLSLLLLLTVQRLGRV